MSGRLCVVAIRSELHSPNGSQTLPIFSGLKEKTGLLATKHSVSGVFVALLRGGANIDIVGCDLWEFEDGLIVKKDTYYKQKT